MSGLEICKIDLDTEDNCKNTHKYILKYCNKMNYRELYIGCIKTQKMIIMNRMYKLHNKLKISDVTNIKKNMILDIALFDDHIIINVHDSTLKLYISYLDQDLSTFYVNMWCSDSNKILTIMTYQDLLDYIQKWKRFVGISESWISKRKPKRRSRGSKTYDNNNINNNNITTTTTTPNLQNVDEFIKTILSISSIQSTIQSTI